VNDYLERLFSLQGRVALVTGASRGIGAALVQALAGAGAYTVGLGRSDTPASPFPEGADYRQCNILDAGSFESACASIVKAKGRLDILVNTAGITLPASQGAEAIEVFNQTLATNLVAAHRCCQVAAERMKGTGGGSIINITSIGSVLGFPDNPAYVASKGGLRLLTKALAMDFAADRIRVNNLAPGYVRTEMTEASFADPVRHAERLQHMMIKRWGNPQDLAGAAIFLASDASTYVTGIDLFVDGGWTAKGL
jgi:NAD(P)-dependent dehydrogenase (short-subunit alcohol dehydrogenase family)